MKQTHQHGLLCSLLCCCLSISSAIIPIINFNSTNIINVITVEILKTCYTNDKTLVIHGDSDQTAIKHLSRSQLIPTIVYDDLAVINVDIRRQEKFKLFLMTANSIDQIQQRLHAFKRSPWWNIAATFFILNELNTDCAIALDILKALWQINAILAFFICQNLKKKPTIYSYNPYTNRAPQSWIKVHRESNGWTMYNRSYHKVTKNICEDMLFDRTKYLDGAQIKIVVARAEENFQVKSKFYDNSTEVMFRDDVRIAKAMELSLNATIKIDYVVNDWDSNVKVQACFQPLQNASSDLALCLRSSLSIYNLTATYPVLYSSLIIITRKRGYYTPVEKISRYYGIVTLVSMIVILTMTFIVVIMSDKYQRVSFALFELIRLIVNVSLHTKMNSLSRKIFFCLMFLYFLIIQATFQGHISAFLTKDEERSNVKSLEDLHDTRYNTIFTTHVAQALLDEPTLDNKMSLARARFCFQQILENDAIACISEEYFNLNTAIKYNLHYKKIPFISFPVVYAIRDDWPLKKRINKFFILLEQSGCSERWSTHELMAIIAQHKGILARSLVRVRVISIKALSFAIIFLGFGLSCASVCFVIERITF